MTRTRSLALAATVFFLTRSPCVADIVITSSTPVVSVQAGQTFSVAFYVTPTGTTAATGLVDYSTEFKINPVGTVPQSLQFTTSQTDSFLDHAATPANYIFNPNGSSNTNSTDAAITPPAGGFNYPEASRQATFHDSLTHSYTDLYINDVTANLQDQSILASNSLLTVLTFVAPTNVTSLETFTVDVLNNANTYFDSNEQSSIAYEYTPVTITILPASAVPLPPSMVLVGLGLITSGATSAAARWRSIRSR